MQAHGDICRRIEKECAKIKIKISNSVFTGVKKRRCVGNFVFKLNEELTNMALKEKQIFRLEQIVFAAHDLFRISLIQKNISSLQEADVKTILDLCHKIVQKLHATLVPVENEK